MLLHKWYISIVAASPIFLISSTHIPSALYFISLGVFANSSLMTFKVYIWVFILYFISTAKSIRYNKLVEKPNPCCSLPCLNRGVCTPLSDFHFECDCPNGYYGKTCEQPSTTNWLIDKLNLRQIKNQKLALSGKFLWGIINNIPTLHNLALRSFFLSSSDLGGYSSDIWQFPNFGIFGNQSFFNRGLPPVPLECPTPLGMKGPQNLPKIDDVFEKLFKRTDFKPCPFGTNLMFVTFSQLLAYQFFKSGSDFNQNQQYDMGYLYGSDEHTRKALRSWKDGKLKARIINGEEYPPYLEDVPNVNMYYPENKNNQKVFPKWAMGHKMFSISPLMFTIATIWLREHNRICNIILKEHPDWNDERIYQTAKWITLGELLTITTEEYLQHMAQYRIKLSYKPNLLQDNDIPKSSQMQHEFGLTFEWHHIMPDVLDVHGKYYNMSNIMFSNNRIVFEHGLDAIVDTMSRSPAGQISSKNTGKAFERNLKELIEEGRRTRVHSFNNYRKFYGLEPYKSFEDLVGNNDVAKALKELYGDIDAVEFVVGIFLEKHPNSVIPATMLLLTMPVAVREIISNPVGSSALWRPSTFGGKIGFDIVQKANLRKLFCLNLKGFCKNNVWVSFRTPWEVTSASKRINLELNGK